MKNWVASHETWVLGYFLLVSIVAFALMGIDKRRARKGAWRIRERTLFLWAFLGGSPGAIAGMWCFRHKTRHWYFRFGLPAILLAETALGLWLWLR